jgi:FAD binding domain-containing protein
MPGRQAAETVRQNQTHTVASERQASDEMRKFLTPHARAIGRPAGPAQDDAVDPSRVEGTPAALKSDLIQLVGKDQVLHRIFDLVRYASDASPYRYLPQVVVVPRTIDDVRAILAYCARTGRHATFRAGGTSLNGQSQSDDILIDVRRHWAGMVVEDGGARLRARPGAILGQANAVLRQVGRRLGPDPASADVATIGGVIANNAGGMRSTLERNAYHTVSSLTLVLASGTVIDTAAQGAEAAFAAAEPELAAGLMQLRSELLADEELARRVRHKFAIRNINGYALSALLDADAPLEIFRRLIVGSEGTLPWSSKGYIRGHKWMAATTSDALWEWSGHGTQPVVIDAASCTHGLLDDVKNYLDGEHRARLEQITLMDSIAWCDSLFPALTLTRRVERAAVHPTCSTAHLGMTKTLERLAGRLAGEVLVPVGTTCCGTAGDRGLLHPELVVSATREEKAGLDTTPAQAYLSANRTCEMGLRQATGFPYESFVFLLEELTRPMGTTSTR